MYESPINLKIEEFVDNVQRATQAQILYKVREIVDVDKDELLRALKYDRDQYFKGYKDGKRDAVRYGYWKEDGDIQICSECGEEHCWADYRAPYCETCGAKMIGEMQYKMLYHSAFPDGKESGDAEIH